MVIQWHLMGFNGIYDDIPPGKSWRNYGKSPSFSWLNQLFRNGHFQCRKLWMFTRGCFPILGMVVIIWIHRNLLLADVCCCRFIIIIRLGFNFWIFQLLSHIKPTKLPECVVVNNINNISWSIGDKEILRIENGDEDLTIHPRTGPWMARVEVEWLMVCHHWDQELIHALR